jgi:hypothetical protein
LVDGEGEIAGAEQLGHRHGRVAERTDTLGIELSVAAHGAFGGDVGDHQAHRTIALDLQIEHALVLERRGEGGRKRDHFRKGGCHG